MNLRIFSAAILLHSFLLFFFYTGIINESRYNLRSNRGEYRIPIQLQLASDTDFLTVSGDRPDSSQSRQVAFTDLSDSGSDIATDALIDHSDQNLSPHSHVFEQRVHNAGKDLEPQASGSNHTSTDQNQILAQFSALGARLDSMESSLKTVKKTNDSTKLKKSRFKTKTNLAHTGSKGVVAVSLPVQMVHKIPPPSQLREEARTQEEEPNRLKHLADNVKPGMAKIKSQRGGLVDVFVNHKVRWPHEFVLSGLMYNQLSPVQCMAGFCQTIRE